MHLFILFTLEYSWRYFCGSLCERKPMCDYLSSLLSELIQKILDDIPMVNILGSVCFVNKHLRVVSLAQKINRHQRYSKVYCICHHRSNAFLWKVINRLSTFPASIFAMKEFLRLNIYYRLEANMFYRSCFTYTWCKSRLITACHLILDEFISSWFYFDSWTFPLSTDKMNSFEHCFRLYVQWCSRWICMEINVKQNEAVQILVYIS